MTSVAVAASRTVSPKARRNDVAGDTVTVLACCATVTDALPDTEPAVAVMVAVPSETAVTSPASTVATDALLLVQLTVAPAMTVPFWSRTVAVNRIV